MITNIRIVLVNTSHPGNIGAAARAMKTMGLSELRLVAPKNYPSDEAVARASGADDVLANAEVCSSLAQAVADCRLVIASSARARRLRWPEVSTRDIGSLLVAEAKLGPVALVFGRERTGLTNEELQCANYTVTIPANPAYPSLNLAAAVQVLSYEIQLAMQEGDPVRLSQKWVTAADMEKFYAHFGEALHDVGFFNAGNPEMVMRRLRRLFNRTRLDQNEVNILRGMLSAAQMCVNNSTKA